jgi:hypothetical protein
MTFPLILFFICAAVTVFFFRRISVGKINALNELSKQKQAVESKYDYLVRERAGLKKELAHKERRLATLVNNQEGIRIKTASEMHIEEETEEDRISNLLISMGKLSVEQNEKVKQKMDVLKMDFLATCLTLGYIDAETSKKILKRHK